MVIRVTRHAGTIALLTVAPFVAAGSASAQGLQLNGHVESGLSGRSVAGDLNAFTLYTGLSPGVTFHDDVRIDAKGSWPQWTLSASYNQDLAPAQRFSLSLNGPGLQAEVGEKTAASGLPGLLGWDEKLSGLTLAHHAGDRSAYAWVGQTRGIPAHDQMSGTGGVGPYALAYGPVIAGSVRLSVAGRSLIPGVDFTVDATNALITFADPVPDGLDIEVDYRYQSGHPRYVFGGSVSRRTPNKSGLGALYVQEMDAPPGTPGWAPAPANSPLGGLQRLYGVGGGWQLPNGVSLNAELVGSQEQTTGGPDQYASAWRLAADYGAGEQGVSVGLRQVGPGFTVPGLAKVDNDYRQLDAEARYAVAPKWRGILDVRDRMSNVTADPARPADRLWRWDNTLRWQPDSDTQVDFELGRQLEWNAYHPERDASASWIGGFNLRRTVSDWHLSADQNWVETVSNAPARPGGAFSTTHLDASYAPSDDRQLDAMYDRQVQPAARFGPSGADAWARLRLSGRAPLGRGQLEGQLSQSETAAGARILDELGYGRVTLSGKPFLKLPQVLGSWSVERRVDDWRGNIGVRAAARQIPPGSTAETSNSWQLGGPIGHGVNLQGTLGITQSASSPGGGRQGTIDTGLNATYVKDLYTWRGGFLTQVQRGSDPARSARQSAGVRWSPSDGKYIDLGWTHGNLSLGHSASGARGNGSSDNGNCTSTGGSGSGTSGDEGDCPSIPAGDDNTSWSLSGGWTKGPIKLDGSWSATLGSTGDLAGREAALDGWWSHGPWQVHASIDDRVSWWSGFLRQQKRELGANYQWRPGVTLHSALNWDDAEGALNYASQGWRLGLAADF